MSTPARKQTTAKATESAKTRLRAQQRILVQRPVRAWADTVADEHVLKLIDVSETGARVQGGFFRQTPSQLRFEWALVPGLKPETFTCRVVWRRGGLLGLRFRKLDARVLCLLKALIRYHR
jgi:hypothetical protein